MKRGLALATTALMFAALTGCDKLPGGLGGKSEEAVHLTAYPEHVYWGDTHLHTANSPDAFGFGNRLDAEASLRFARGEEVTATMGVKAKLAQTLDFRRGVPMGGILPRRTTGAPSLIVSAIKDPIGANLDRVQIVKGWTDARGKAHEKVFDIAWSLPQTGKPVVGRLPPIGNTVNLAVPGYANSIGAPNLATVWRDPEFDPARRSFYYLRVIEIPTPRWVAYDAVRYHLKLPAGIPMISQERAYTSPIWYEPNS